MDWANKQNNVNEESWALSFRQSLICYKYACVTLYQLMKLFKFPEGIFKICLFYPLVVGMFLIRSIGLCIALMDISLSTSKDGCNDGPLKKLKKTTDAVIAYYSCQQEICLLPFSLTGIKFVLFTPATSTRVYHYRCAFRGSLHSRSKTALHSSAYCFYFTRLVTF